MEAGSPEHDHSSPPPSENKHKRTRRDLLAKATGAAVTIGAAALARKLPSPGVHEHIDNVPPQIPTPEQKTFSQTSDQEPFLYREANEVVQSEGITAGEYFVPSERVLDSLSAFRTADLLPIFPPSVIARKELIKNLSKDYDVPENVIATIMTIESAGYEQAGSPAGAQGLFQVMAMNFPPELQNDEAAMFDPQNNGDAAMSLFSTTCLPFARSFEGTDTDSATVYARAMMAYNGGTGTASKPDEDMPSETRKYRDFFLKFCIDAEVAQGLRDKGLTDIQIVKQLATNDVDARAYAVNTYFQTFDNSDFVNYHNGMVLAAKGIPAENMDGITPLPGMQKEQEAAASQMQQAYQEYKQNPGYGMPLPPALRTWTSIGGYSQLALSEENLDPQRYFQLSTQ